MPTTKIEFEGSQGFPLSARLDLPAEPARAYAIFAHCFTCSKDYFAVTRVARALSEQGIAVLRFDFTGLGESDGEFASTNFSSNIQDLLTAADWLRENHSAPSLLIGHSLGGTAVLSVAKNIPEVVAVATIGAPFEPEHLLAAFEGQRAEIDDKGEAEVAIVGRKFVIQRQFLEDLKSHSMAEEIAELDRALIVFHSPVDAFVGIDNAAKIFATAKHPKSFVSLDDADHLLNKPADAQYVADVLAAWVGRFLPPAPTREPSDPNTEETVVVAETGTGKFTNRVSIGRHDLVADEPTSSGGDDLGPSPYQFLLAGLGACTSMTLRMYAERKGIAVDQVSVSLQHSRIHAQDCEDCETKEGYIDHIDRAIEITGDLNEKQRTRMMEIADRCPVHRTLQSEIVIESRQIES
ncbi:MAG: alpha/beta fold hydrolase [bacterium]|nr:alpha/beta fold hydrolase [bacterium]